MENKKCTLCKEGKELSEFNKNKGKKDGLNNICRVCSQKKSKAYYTSNTEKHKNATLQRSKLQILNNRKKLFDFYKSNPCVDCNESDPMVLECDHRSDKKFEVSKLVGNGYSWDTIQKEIDKCDVRCANCHRRKTAIQFGWYQDLIKAQEVAK